MKKMFIMPMNVIPYFKNAPYVFKNIHHIFDKTFTAYAKKIIAYL